MEYHIIHKINIFFPIHLIYIYFYIFENIKFITSQKRRYINDFIEDETITNHLKNI